MKGLSILFCSLAIPAFTQVNTGSLSGNVSDPTGAVVPNAKLMLRNQTTGVETALTANETGWFKASFVPPGAYTLRAEASGFRVHEERDIEIRLSVETTVQVRLELGATSEVVVVEGGAPVLQTSSAQLSYNVTSERVVNLPGLTNGLDRLVFLAPGIVPGFGNINSNGAVFSANGQRARSNNFLLDGQDNNDSSIGGPGFFFGQVEAVGEFQVISNQFSAEYGRNAGAIVNLTVRNGTNDFHGGAAWFHRDDQWLTALTNFQRRSGLTVPPKRIENQFGGSAGGRIIKDKLFYFGYLYRDTLRRDDRLEATAANVTPTEAGLQALSRAFPNSNAVKALLQYGPVARKAGNPTFLPGFSRVDRVNGPSGPVDVEMGRLVRFVPRPENSWNVGGKVDFAPSEKNRVNFKYYWQDTKRPNNGGGVNGYFYDVPATSWQVGGSYTGMLSANKVNEFRFSYVKLAVYFMGGDTFTFDEIGKNVANFTLPAGYLGFGLATNIPQFREVNRYQFQDNFNWQRGRHAMKFGVQFNKDNIPLGFLPTVNGQFVFGAFQDFVDNRPAQFNGAAGDAKQTPSQLDQAYYFQDDWRVRPNFTVNLGVRYEYSGQPINILNDVTAKRESNSSTALWNQTLPLEARIYPRLNPDKNNIAPRIGFAYTPGWWKKLTGENKTVIRGGYSVSYDPSFYNLLLNAQTAAPVVSLYSLAGSAAIPVPSDPSGANLLRIAAPPRGQDPRRLNQTLFDPGFHLPYSQNWSFGVQREIHRRTGVEVRYVGTRAIGQFGSLNGNPNVQRYVDNGWASVLPSGVRPGVNPDCANCSGRVNPNYGLVRVRANTASSTYHGFQTRVDTRLFDQLVFGAAYTFSKTMDNVSEVFEFAGSGSLVIAQSPFDLTKGERGLSNNHLPHAFSMNFVWQVPLLKQQKGLAGRLLGGWQVSMIDIWTSGRPWQPLQFNSGEPSVTDRTLNSAFFGRFDSLRPFGGNPSAPLSSVGIITSTGMVDNFNRNRAVGYNDVRWIINNATSARLFGTPFGVGRNLAYGPRFQRADVAIFKNFKIHERLTLTYRLEATNAFNHPALGLGIINADQATFANFTETEVTPRVIRMGLRLGW